MNSSAVVLAVSLSLVAFNPTPASALTAARASYTTPAVAAPLQAQAPVQVQAAVQAPFRTRLKAPALTEVPAALGDVSKVANFILVDADTANVLASKGERELFDPSSMSKAITALVAADRLDRSKKLTISRSAASMPARKIGATTGQQWNFDDLMYAMMLVSANDASYALGEASSGNSINGFKNQTGVLASKLSFSDSPTLVDPSGLTEEGAVGEGNKMSARDLAIAGRAYLQNEYLMQVASTKTYTFTDPSGASQTLTNHNQLLGQLEGMNGIKTAFTSDGGKSIVASASRNGRTMLVVINDAPDIWAVTTRFLNYAFTVSVPNQTSTDQLPLRPGEVREPTTTTTTQVASTTAESGVSIGSSVSVAREDSKSSPGFVSRVISFFKWLLILAAVLIGGLRGRVMYRRFQRNRRRSRYAELNQRTPRGRNSPSMVVHVEPHDALIDLGDQELNTIQASSRRNITSISSNGSLSATSKVRLTQRTGTQNSGGQTDQIKRSNRARHNGKPDLNEKPTRGSIRNSVRGSVKSAISGAFSSGVGGDTREESTHSKVRYSADRYDVDRRSASHNDDGRYDVVETPMSVRDNRLSRLQSGDKLQRDDLAEDIVVLDATQDFDDDTTPNTYRRPRR